MPDAPKCPRCGAAASNYHSQWDCGSETSRVHPFQSTTCRIRELGNEIAQLRADLELDVEFAHAPDCTGKGISRMCAGCIEAEQLRQFAEIERLTAAEPWVEGQLLAADFDDPLCEDGKYIRVMIRVPAREVAAGRADVRFPAI